MTGHDEEGGLADPHRLGERFDDRGIRLTVDGRGRDIDSHVPLVDHEAIAGCSRGDPNAQDRFVHLGGNTRNLIELGRLASW